MHDIWREHLQVGDLVVDATCGNGGDTWEICQAVLGPKSEWSTRFGDVKTRVVAVDIQQVGLGFAGSIDRVQIRRLEFDRAPVMQ